MTTIRQMSAPHAATAAALVADLDTDSQRGLSSAEAASRLASYGPNALPEPKGESGLLRFLKQFTSPLVLVLLGAALVATVVGITDHSGQTHGLARFADALAILSIVLLNAVLGHVQEYRAETALLALRRLTVPNTRALRDGALLQLPADKLVPGDVIQLTAGDAVPADVRLLEAVGLEADESTLTGESIPVAKDPRGQLAADTAPTEQTTMAFLGTTVIRGTARAIVVRTGGATELGRIGALVLGIRREDTPLEQSLEVFGRKILWLCLIVSLFLFGWGLLAGSQAWHLLLLQVVSFGVAAIPEGLPAITTIALALGTQRMAKRGVIVRKLAAVESLGAASIICTDKTGTLTENQMTVQKVYVGGRHYQVTGEGYSRQGSILADGKTLDIGSLPAGVVELLRTGVLCNNASLSARTDCESWRVIGDPTEGALLSLGQKGGIEKEPLVASHPRQRELPFESERKRMAVVVTQPDGLLVAHVKGSVDGILPLCSRIHDGEAERALSAADRTAIHAEACRMGDTALRVLALAHRESPPAGQEERELTFLGLVGMLDPPREAVKEAIAACKTAGITVTMITGDHPATARAVAEQIGLIAPQDELLTGTDLKRLSDDDLCTSVKTIRVFARTTAEQKLRIVSALKENDEVVAMTGDGINDAPALREAHVGVAMGRCGTDVARQAAGIVITDDNFATIVAGVREGRAIFRNIQKFIFYLLSSNAALAVVVFVAAFSPRCLPLTSLMILCINLVTNGLPALALGIDPPDREQMDEPPRCADRDLFNSRHYLAILYVGLAMGLPAVGLYYVSWFGISASPEWSRTMAFAVLGLGPLFHAWNCRSAEHSLWAQRPIIRWPLVLACALSGAIQVAAVALPALRPIFHCYPLSLRDWLIALGLSALVIPLVEVGKAVRRASAHFGHSRT